LDEINGEPRYLALLNFFKENNAKWVIVDAGIEHELKDFDDKEKDEMRKALVGKDDLSFSSPFVASAEEGALAEEDGIDTLIKKGYELLDLITYFTTGEDESRAWTIGRGWTAPEAGTAIHTDFKEKFIRAEVIEWDKLLEAGSYGNAREKGLLRTEGKEYVVKDGDVIEFKV
jgi:ribosome-binding ATPase YchF (GTP1/OBG family)